MNTEPDRYESRTLMTEKIVSGRKEFFIDLKENNIGRFIKITERTPRGRVTVMIPSQAMGSVESALSRLITQSEELPRGFRSPEVENN